METAEFMEKYKDLPKLYVTYEFYSPEVSPALYFGLCYSGMEKYKYIPILEKKYPLSTFYSFPENTFHDWGNVLQWPDIVSKNKQMLVSFYYTDPSVVDGTLQILNQINQNHRVIELNKIFENPNTGEQLYIMNRIGTINDTIDSLHVIRCDAETVVGGSLVSTDSAYTFQGKECLFNKFSHSGQRCLQLNTLNQYGFGFHLLLNKERHYEISAWRKSDSKKGVIAVNGPNFSLASSKVVETGVDGWEKISMKFQIPQDYPDSTIAVFAYNENGSQVTYFDDFMIVEY